MPILETVDGLVMSGQSLVDGLNGVKSEITQYGQERYDAGWDEAMLQAGTGGSSDKIYSEAEMNQIIADTKAPLEAMVAQRDNQITVMNEQAQANIQTAVDSAVAALKAQVAADFESTQVDDNAFLAKYKS